MENIKLNLTIDEANTILASLGQQPYIKVVDLIQKIQRQGASQLDSDETDKATENQKELKDVILSENGK